MTDFFYYCFYFIYFFCWLQTRRCYRTLWLTPPSYPRAEKKGYDPGSERKERKQKEEGPGLATTGPPRNQPLLCLSPPRLTMGAEESVFMDPHGPTIAPMCPTAVTADKIKHIHFQKESKNLFLPTISVLPLCSQSAQPFQPFATQAIPVVSTCVMTAVRWGYTLQFARRPPHFRGVLANHSAQRKHSSPPRRGDESPGKRSHRNVPPAQSESGLYTRYFLVPKKEGVLWPILDLRLLNYTLMKRLFRMITLKQILPQICPGDWFMSLDLKEGLASRTPSLNGVSGLCTSPGPLEGPLLATYITRAASSRSDSAC